MYTFICIVYMVLMHTNVYMHIQYDYNGSIVIHITSVFSTQLLNI